MKQTSSQFQRVIRDRLSHLFFHQQKDIPPLKLPKDLHVAQHEVMDELGTSASQLPVFDRPSLELFKVSDLTICIDNPIHFNTYRLKTFRSDAYDTVPTSFHVDISKYRTWCRKHASDSLQGGIRSDVWTFPKAEATFGRSESPGDLGGAGSAGWKWIAFQHYSLDLLFIWNKQPFARIAPYEEVLYHGKVHTLQQLINADKRDVVENYLDRTVRSKLTSHHT